MTTMQERIQKAIETTRRVIPGYFEKTVAQRAEFGEPAGSIIEGVTPVELEASLAVANWEPYSHPQVMAGCEAFKASIPGRLGVVSLNDLPVDTSVTLDDRKKTGKVSAVVKGVRGLKVDYTILILGQEQGEEVVFTFHPGDPIRASQVNVEGMHGKVVTPAEAIAMGLETAKIE